ncbi:MAG: hypothetical protein IT169_09785 [Bryobacterales bacterium]|nr:hypothetical protein [Bryobacterales bacterium]
MNTQQISQNSSVERGLPNAARRSVGAQRGGAFIEMTLATIFLFIPLLVGLVVVGLATINRVQLEQITRDVGIMHARGIDFTLAQNKLLFNKLTQGSTFVGNDVSDNATFNGTMVISTVRKLGASECASGCANQGFPVVTYRVVLGNPALYTSWLANPASIGSNGKVNNYKNDGSARAPALETLMPAMLSGEEAFVAEGFMITPGISFPDVNSDTRVTTWAIF